MKYINKGFMIALSCTVIISMLTFLSGCGIEPKESNPNQTSTTIIDDSTFQTQDFIIPNWASDYSSIIEEYRRFVGYLINDEIDIAIDDKIFSAPDSDLVYNWSCMQIETNNWSYRDFPKTQEAFGYAKEDLNGDGNNELILLLQDYTVLAVFSMANESPKLIDAFWSRHRCAIYDSGLLYTLSSGGANYWEYTINQISQDENKLIILEQYGCENGLYKIVNDEKHSISESELDEFHQKFPILFDTTASEITKNSGIVFIPLFD